MKIICKLENAKRHAETHGFSPEIMLLEIAINNHFSSHQAGELRDRVIAKFGGENYDLETLVEVHNDYIKELNEPSK